MNPERKSSLLPVTEKLSSLDSYGRLREEVQKTLQQGRKKAEAAVDKERTKTYWEIGHLIDRHIHAEKPEAKRAEYGREVVKRLAQDLGIGASTIYSFLMFSRTYKILPARGKLSWRHYQSLLSVKDDSERTALIEAAEKENWTSRTLEMKIREANGSKKRNEKKVFKFTSKRGSLATYQMGPRDWVDLGFSIFTAWRPLENLVGFKEGDILRWVATKKKFEKIEGGNRSDLYTYRAQVERVVDGDTLWVHVDLGFRLFVRQKLRLRGVNAAELHTAAGERAKRFLEEEFKKVSSVLITTTKPDKWDRYLADVWIGETNLNKLLLKKGFASLMSPQTAEQDWNEDNWGRF